MLGLTALSYPIHQIVSGRLSNTDPNWKQSDDGRRTIQILVEQLGNADPLVRLLGLDALEKSAWKPDNASQRAYLAAIKEDWTALEKLGGTALDAIETIVTGKPMYVDRHDIEGAKELVVNADRPFWTIFKGGCCRLLTSE